MTFGDSLESLFSSFMKFITAILVVCSARWRLQREQRELKTPQERAFRVKPCRRKASIWNGEQRDTWKIIQKGLS